MDELRARLYVPGHSCVNYQPQETRSRLSKTVDHVLRDNIAIPHYMHFMERRGADHLVRFWLEAESFRSTSWSRVRAHSLNSVKHSSLAEPVPASSDGSELRELGQYTPSTLSRDSSIEGPAVQSEQRDPSSTEAGLRPGTPRVDTPSRQAPSRTGTPVKGQSSSTLRDLSDKLMKSEIKLSLYVYLRVFNFECTVSRLLLLNWLIIDVFNLESKVFLNYYERKLLIYCLSQLKNCFQVSYMEQH